MLHWVLHKNVDLDGFSWSILDIKKPGAIILKGLTGLYWTSLYNLVVRMGGLEPPRPKSPAPQYSVPKHLKPFKNNNIRRRARRIKPTFKYI